MGAISGKLGSDETQVPDEVIAGLTLAVHSDDGVAWRYLLGILVIMTMAFVENGLCTILMAEINPHVSIPSFPMDYFLDLLTRKLSLNDPAA